MSTDLFQSHEERQRRQERGPAYAKAARKEDELRRQIGVLERQLARDQDGNDPDSPSGASEGGGSNRDGSSFAIQKYRGKKSGNSPSNSNKKSPTRAEKLEAERQKKASVLERRIEILEHEIMKDQKVSAQLQRANHVESPAPRALHYCPSRAFARLNMHISLHRLLPPRSDRHQSYARKSKSLTIWRNSRQRCKPRPNRCRRSWPKQISWEPR